MDEIKSEERLTIVPSEELDKGVEAAKKVAIKKGIDFDSTNLPQGVQTNEVDLDNSDAQ